MAGRPVTSRGGLTGVHYGMIAFAVISVASLGLFIFQLTKNKEAQDRAEKADTLMTRYGTPPQYYAEEAQARRSNVFAVMNDDLRKLALLVTGEGSDVGVTVLAKASGLLADIATRKPGTVEPSATLLTALTRMDELHSEERNKSEAEAQVIKDLQAERDSLTAQLKSTRDQFEAQSASLSEQLKQAQDEKASALQDKDKQLGDLERELTGREQRIAQLTREGNNQVREQKIENGRLQKQIESLQAQIKNLKPSSFDPNAILTKADGKILRAIPGSEVVYINVGSVDKLKVGMGFEVYSQTREVPKSLRGKASLEVVTLMEDTSECRVTRRTPGQPIMEGDIIVNIAYERGRKPKFVVRGDFDLNYDGVIDFDGAEEVKSLIRQWGGQIADDLDESVDFVVIGLAPKPPTFGPGEQVSDVVRDQAQQRELMASQFRALIEQAQKMYIPVITQNQFLFLTGYAGEATVVRR